MDRKTLNQWVATKLPLPTNERIYEYVQMNEVKV